MFTIPSILKRSFELKKNNFALSVYSTSIIYFHIGWCYLPNYQIKLYILINRSFNLIKTLLHGLSYESKME